MLRTSLRTKSGSSAERRCSAFLSSNAQDFIEDVGPRATPRLDLRFLSSNAQDFIEDRGLHHLRDQIVQFLSSNAQDFIEDHHRRA